MKPEGLKRAMAGRPKTWPGLPWAMTVSMSVADGVAVKVAVKVLASLATVVLPQVVLAVWHDGELAFTAKPQTLFVPTCA